MAYIGNTPGVSSQRYVQREVIAGSPKSAFIVTSGYSLGYVDVIVNGSQLDEADFTAADGVTVTLAQAAAVGDIVRIIAWLPRGLSDGYLKSEADAKFLRKAGEDGVTVTSGKVGIGVSSPLAMSDVESPSLGNTTGNEQYLFRGKTNTGNDDKFDVLYKRNSNAGGWTSADLIIRRNVDSSAQQSEIRLNADNSTSFWTNGASRARIDSAGRVTTPYQPAFSARKNGTVTGPAAATGYDSVDFNIGGHFNASTGKFTAPVAGLYLFWVVGGNINQITIDINLNGNRVIRTENADAGFKWLGGVATAYLNANDYVDVFVAAGNPMLGSSNQGGFGGYLIG